MENPASRRAPFVVFVERADHGAGGGFDAAAAEGDTDEACNHAADAGDEGEGDVAEHDEEAGVIEGAFCTEDAVGDPAAEDAGEVNAAAIRPGDAALDRLAEAEAAIADAVVEVHGEDAVHPEKGKTLPQFDVKERRKLARLAEEGFGHCRSPV